MTRTEWLNQQPTWKLQDMVQYAGIQKAGRDSATKRDEYVPVYADMPGKWEAEIELLSNILATR